MQERGSVGIDYEKSFGSDVRLSRWRRLTHHDLDGIDDGVGEQGNQHRVQREGTYHFSGIHLLIFVLQGDDDQSPHNQTTQLEIGEVPPPNVYSAKLKLAVKRTTITAAAIVPNVFFMICFLLGTFL